MRYVEGVEITCLVDNNVDVLLPSTPVARRPVLKRDWYSKPLIAEHGFCAAITIDVRGSKQRLLLDSGLDPFAASNNVDVLEFNLANCEGVISSHGHVDHAGGLINIRNKIDAKRKIPLVVHHDAFKNRMVKFPDGRIIELPSPNKTQLIQSGYDIVERQSPSSWLEDTVLVTGEIPRNNDFEKGFPSHYSKESDGEVEADPLIRDDQAIVLSIKDKGLVIVTGCGHAGVINTINYAKELTGEDRIYAVIGGMHLSGKLFEPIIGRTADELADLKPRFIAPCHCSGLKAVTEIAKQMPDAFIQNSVGTTYAF
jgi:7,8-dihydropterin-6-yl-methyl-4-(beta-D-ribofuranosyl)aminobenzene 5'-phosphate synthase